MENLKRPKQQKKKTKIFNLNSVINFVYYICIRSILSCPQRVYCVLAVLFGCIGMNNLYGHRVCAFICYDMINFSFTGNNNVS